MDNSTRNEWSASLAASVAAAIGAAALLAVLALGGIDPAGRILVGVATAALVAMAVLGGLRRPRLAIDSGHLVVHGLRSEQRYGPDDLLDVEVKTYPRLGRRTVQLELEIRETADHPDRLLIFGRWELGTDPRDVYDALEAAGLAGPNR